MSLATNDRETIAWAWPAVFLLLMLMVVAGVAFAAVWSWDRYAGSDTVAAADCRVAAALVQPGAAEPRLSICQKAEAAA